MTGLFTALDARRSGNVIRRVGALERLIEPHDPEVNPHLLDHASWGGEDIAS